MTIFTRVGRFAVVLDRTCVASVDCSAQSRYRDLTQFEMLLDTIYGHE
jgi:hypothetical protein